jgi:hypothetical protein
MSKKVDNALSTILDIDILPPETVTSNNDITIYSERKPHDDSELIAHEREDYDKARSTLHGIIDKGNSAILDIIELARESENPKVYEVLATMMKTLTETTKDLYNIHNKVREIKSAPGKNSKGGNVDETSISVDKAVFIGTTADLLKMQKDIQNG